MNLIFREESLRIFENSLMNLIIIFIERIHNSIIQQNVKIVFHFSDTRDGFEEFEINRLKT